MFGALSVSLFVLAQVPDSTYDRYALRLVHGPGWTGVLQGIQAEYVGGGTFVPRVALFATAGDSVRRQYEASRSRFRRYAVLGGLSIAGVLATITYYDGTSDRDWNTPVGIGLPIATIAVSWAGAASATSGEDYLRRAIWHYNRELPRTAQSAASDCPYDRCALRVQPRVWSTRIVQGANGARVGGLGSRLDLFAAANDSARRHFEAFRAAYRDARVARRIGLGAYVGAGILYAAGRSPAARGFAVGFLLAGYAAAHGAAYASAEAASELDSAIWFYNRALPN